MEKYSLQFREQSVQSVLKRGESKFVQLSLEPGEGLTKHRAPLALTVIVLTGQIRFTVGTESEVLNASEMLAIEPTVEHAVEALERSTVLLVLTPNGVPTKNSTAAGEQALEHENAYQHPELLKQIAPELRPLVHDHIHVCSVLHAVEQSLDRETIRTTLNTIEQELKNHFKAEENVLFPRIANHIGGMDVGPIARLLEEHRAISRLHKEAEELMTVDEHGDEHARSLLTNKVLELSTMLLNHLGKEDSHLFPMASRLLTSDEKAVIANELREYDSIGSVQ
ncbi:hemerythrin domain-containing protein [Ferroacidibacillus organovorans]|uniref:Hemerythrin-like domain-containing protein n=1 Tax=Ferroacidibacillus organovorans TaxID=1765683 RepID=A0A1V4ERQ7_9BACL|nr:hemerythrin domain-containing protein [Ferroacidibacillus organovorans]OPG15581.1 hypothetical protein B2M26_10960 [Ferroacidibacillus organovorans]